jgi:hypothetical protein
MLAGIKAFTKDYPESKTYLFYGGQRQMREGEIELIPINKALKDLDFLLR